MPGRGYLAYNKKKKGKSKPYLAKAKKPSTLVTRNYSKQVISPNYRTVLGYNQGVSVAISSGSISTDQVFRLNSLYDPDFTGGGHQPYGRDTLATIYNRYRVHRVSGFVSFASNSNVPCRVVIVPTNTRAAITDIDLAAETPYAQSTWLLTNQPTIIPFKFSLNKIVGVTKRTYGADDRYQSVFSTDPAEDIDLHIVAWSSGSSQTIFANVHIKYYTEVWDPHELAQS